MLRFRRSRESLGGAHLACRMVLALALMAPLSGCFLVLGAGVGAGGVVRIS